MSIRVIIADDHGIVRQGLRSLLEHTDEMDFQVVAEAENGRRVIQLCREEQPDIVIMDVTMPELNGIEATRRIVRGHSKSKVFALSVHIRRDFVLNMLNAGACGYLLKEGLFDELLGAMKTILAGETYLSPVLRPMVIEEITRRNNVRYNPKASPLTSREREILQLLSEGKSNKEIAATINRSVKTVEMHRQNTMNKLDLHTVADLTKYAIREGITTFHG